MNKKDGTQKKHIIYDDKEDLKIKRIAHLKNPSQKFLLCVLILLFCFLLCASILIINSYNIKNNKKINSGEIIEVKSPKNHVLISNYGKINESITTKSFENSEDLIITKINTITLTTSKEAKEKGNIKFNIKYDISENSFKKNDIATNDSDLLVRFSYSFDNNNWIYVNNVISTLDSTLNPLMGNYYDIAGLINTLSVATNYDLSADINNSAKMYWRVETIIKNTHNKKINNKLVADFKIEYKNNA